MRKLFTVVAIAIAVSPACAATDANRVGVTTTTSADLEIAACNRTKLSACVYDSDCCGGDWCIERVCE
jgi:hypothetical protein